MKRRPQLTAGATLLLFSLAACGGPDPGPSAGENPRPASAERAKVAETPGPVEIAEALGLQSTCP